MKTLDATDTEQASTIAETATAHHTTAKTAKTT